MAALYDVNMAGLTRWDIYVSDEITGNGSAQSTAHGHDRAPITVFAVPSNLTGGVYVVTYGTHTATNLVATVSTGEKYRLVAIFGAKSGS